MGTHVVERCPPTRRKEGARSGQEGLGQKTRGGDRERRETDWQAPQTTAVEEAGGAANGRVGAERGNSAVRLGGRSDRPGVRGMGCWQGWEGGPVGAGRRESEKDLWAAKPGARAPGRVTGQQEHWQNMRSVSVETSNGTDAPSCEHGAGPRWDASPRAYLRNLFATERDTQRAPPQPRAKMVRRIVAGGHGHRRQSWRDQHKKSLASAGKPTGREKHSHSTQEAQKRRQGTSRRDRNR